MDIKELVAAVRAHAYKNYNKNGWDFVVECWSDEEIEATIRGTRHDDDESSISPPITTAARAIKEVKSVVSIQADYRDEIIATELRPQELTCLKYSQYLLRGVDLMIARMWTKKETQKILTGLRRAGYTVAKDEYGFYRGFDLDGGQIFAAMPGTCLLYTSPSPRD